MNTIGWAGILLAYVLEDLMIAKIFGVFIAFSIGAFLLPALNIYLSEVCPTKYIGLSYTMLNIMAVL